MGLVHGQTVHVHFTASVDGSVIESTISRDPLLVTVGTGQVVRGFERALMMMSPGQSMKLTVPAADAYGEYDSAKVHPIARSHFRHTPVLGETIELADPARQQFVKGVVCRVDADTVWLNFNHPLAGKDITFEIDVVDEDHEATVSG